MEETSLVSVCCLWILRHLDEKQAELEALDYCLSFENVLLYIIILYYILLYINILYLALCPFN